MVLRPLAPSALSLYLCSCKCNQHACGELRVGVKLQAEFHNVLIIAVACLAGSDNKTTVRYSAVVLFKLLLSDEMNGSIIVGEVVGHGLDIMLDLSQVCTLLSNYEALSCVLFTGGENGIFAVSYLLESGLNGNGVLLAVLNALYTSDSIGVTLAYTLAPECVVASLGKNCVAVHSHKREQSRIPTNGDNTDLAGLLSDLVNICEMLGDPCVSIEAVNYVEILYILRVWVGRSFALPPQRIRTSISSL